MFLNPEKIINELDIITSGMSVADFGSGSGYFTIPLSYKVGDSGSVYAIDILENRLNLIENQAKSKNISNINIISANLEVLGGTNLDNNSLDAVLVANILFQSDKKIDIIKEAKRVLISGGYLIIIDWLNNNSVLLPKGVEIDKKQIIEMVKDLGFNLFKEFSVDPYHFGVIFTK
ncbi:MAG: methyltransferase domain-containing protein [Patescibacteria group bacterium]